MNIDEISPAYIGEDVISLDLSDSTPKPRVGNPVIVTVDYSDSEKYGGTTLPLEVVVQGPTPEFFRSHVYRAFKPHILVFSPETAGEHLVLLRELVHNRFVGTLVVQVMG
jgi:hypothetical protein